MKKLTLSISLCVLLLSFLTSAKAQTYCPPNIDFENGGFTNWICNVGAVTQGTTGNPAVLTYPANPIGPSLTQHILKSSGVDTFGLFPTVCNYINGNHFSVKLGDEQIGAICARMKYKVNIPVSNSHFSLTFYYALVFQQPRHNFEAQPGFSVKIIDSVTNLPVNLSSNFTIVQPTSGLLPGFAASAISHNTFDSVYYKNWTASTLSLSGLAGKTVYVQIESFDCAQGGHFGYAYIDFPINCNGNALIQGSNCSPSNLPQLIAPGGYSAYQWYDSSFTNLISINDTLNISTSPTIDTTLHYCILTPFNNWGCIDTVTIKYNPNPAAVADFNYPSSYCLNSTVRFIDNSNTTIAGTYINQWAWNFGDINATSHNPNTDSTQNPTHSYSAMGNYTVCLIAHSNINCLADTICKTININRVVPTVNINFTKDSICGLTDTTTIYSLQTALPGFSYQWIIDSSSVLVSGNLNSIQPIVLKFNAIGNHSIQLISTPNPLDTNCATISSTQIYIKALTPSFGFNALDSVCSNTPITLSVNSLPINSGATSATCATLSQINIGTNNGTMQNAPTVFNGFYTESKIQMLYTKAELNAAGLYGGIISKLAWNVLAKNSTQPYLGFSIKMAAVNYSLLGNTFNGIDTSTPLTLVHYSSAYTTNLGINLFNFNTNFAWNGNSNLLIQICFDNGTSNWTGADIVAKSLMPSTGFCNVAQSDNNALTGCDNYYIGNLAYTYNERPDISIFYCNATPLSSSITYSWSSNPTGISANTSSITDTISLTKTYIVTANDNGCTSTQSHTVKIASGINIQISQSLCMGTVYTYHGKTYTSTGVYYDTIHTNAGCDTMVALNLIFNDISKYINVTDCAPYFFNGNWINTSGYYYDTIPSSTNGCDTIVTLDYKYIISSTTLNDFICKGMPYYHNNKIYYNAGIYIDTINTGTCITIDSLILTTGFTNTTIVKNGDSLYAINASGNILYYEWIDCNFPTNVLNQYSYSFKPVFAGSYAVISSDGICYDTSACFNYNTTCIAHYSTIYDTSNNTFIVSLDTITAQQAVNYLWSFGDGTYSTLATPTHIYTADTIYNLCLRIITANNDTCWYCHIIGKDYQGHIIKKGGFTINIKNPLLNGIENNITNDNQFSIYPNPCKDKLLVISDKLLVNTIEVTDVLGRVMLKNEASNQLINKSPNQQIQLDVSTLSNGIYFIKVMDINGNEMNRKFVKE